MPCFLSKFLPFSFSNSHKHFSATRHFPCKLSFNYYFLWTILFLWDFSFPLSLLYHFFSCFSLLSFRTHGLCQSAVHALRFFCASFDRTFYLPLPKFLFPVPSHFDVLFCRLIFSTFYRRTAMSCGVLSLIDYPFPILFFDFLYLFLILFFKFSSFSSYVCYNIFQLFFFSSHFTILFPNF